MRVSEYLDLEDDGELLARGGGSWAAWSEQDPRLGVVGFDQLRDWLAEATPAEADEVLHALATLAATEGGDDVAAAAVLAWALLPGACRLARELRTLKGDTTLLVAAHLWIEVRSFPWRRLRKVAANVLMNTRAACLREAGAVGQVKRADRTRNATYLIAPTSFFWDRFAAGDRLTPVKPYTGDRGEDVALVRATRLGRIPLERDPALEVLDVLDWACEQDVITSEDRQLLLCLVEEADHVDVRRTGRSNAGLTATEISVRVAPRLGLSQATVRRRAARSLRALAAAADRYAA